MVTYAIGITAESANSTKWYAIFHVAATTESIGTTNNCTVT